VSEPADELLLEGHDRRYAALAWGPEHGRRVLALHGWMDNAASFAELAPRLDGCRVVAPDLPGHGRTEAVDGGQFYHYIDLVWDIHVALDALGWDRAVVLGHSMGGALASLYAGAMGERVEAVVSIDALGPIPDPGERFPERLADGLKARAELALRQRFFASRDEAVAARHADGHLTRRAAEHLARRGVERTHDGWTWCVDRRHRLPSLVRMTEAQIDAALAAISAPMLVVAARATHYPALRPLLRQRFERIADGRLVELDGGHHLHLDDAGPVAEAVLEFLREVPATSRNAT